MMRKFSKGLFAVFACCILAIGLFACGSKNTPPATTDDDDDDPKTEYTIKFELFDDVDGVRVYVTIPGTTNADATGVNKIDDRKRQAGQSEELVAATIIPSEQITIDHTAYDANDYKFDGWEIFDGTTSVKAAKSGNAYTVSLPTVGLSGTTYTVRPSIVKKSGSSVPKTQYTIKIDLTIEIEGNPVSATAAGLTDNENKTLEEGETLGFLPDTAVIPSDQSMDYIFDGWTLSDENEHRVKVTKTSKLGNIDTLTGTTLTLGPSFRTASGTKYYA